MKYLDICNTHLLMNQSTMRSRKCGLTRVMSTFKHNFLLFGPCFRLSIGPKLGAKN